MSGSLVRRALALVALAATAGCTEGTGPQSIGQLRLRAVFAQGEDPATLGLAVSDIRIIVRRNGGSGAVAVDTTMPFEAGATLAWILELAAPPEPVGISASLAQGTLPLYAGTGQASVGEGIDPSSGSVTDVPVRFLGLPVASIEITPGNATTTALGATQQFTAVARDVQGRVVPSVDFTWSSSASAVATINSSGLATGVATGTSTITVSSGSVSNSATLNVTQVVASVDVSPDSAAMLVGGSAKYSASARDSNGHLIGGVNWSWSSADTTIAKVTADTAGNGLAAGIAAGLTFIRATTAGVSDSARLVVLEDDGNQPPIGPVFSVTVTPASATITALGFSQQFIAIARDSSGTVVPGVTFTWSSDNVSIATIDGSGLATGRAVGLTTVRASANGRSGSAALAVVQVPTFVRITPASAMVATGDSAPFTAVAFDGNGNVIPFAQFAWTTTDPAVASVSANGVATGLAAGTAGIRATTGGASATATFQVIQVGSVTVLPGNEPKVQLGDFQQFTAIVRDANGNVVTGLKVTWSSSKPAVASIDPNSGLATSHAVGFTFITATVGGVSGTSDLVIRP